MKTIRNIGLDLLKTWMSFEVIICHFGQGDGYGFVHRLFDLFRVYAVPVFMFISFFFAFNWLTSPSDTLKMTNRLKRIYIPLIIWALIYYVVFKLCAAIGLNIISPSLSALFWQIVTGHSLNPPMWFNVVLMMLTLLYFLLYRHFPSKAVYISVILLVVSMGLEYSGINAALFKNMRFELSYPLGRLVEMIPYASGGLLLGSLWKKYQSKGLWVIVAVVAIVLGFTDLHLAAAKSFDYGGLSLFLRAVGLTCLFSVIPFERAPRLGSIIRNISKYSMGIYCMHLLIGKLLLLYEWDMSPLTFSAIIYLVCLFISFVIAKLPIPSIKSVVV